MSEGLGAKEFEPHGAPIGELTHVNTGWTVELRYPHWDESHYMRSDEKLARSRVVYHRERGATARLLRQEFYAGPQVEVEA